MNGIHIAACGRVTFDPEARFTQGGKAMLVFSMLVDQAHAWGKKTGVDVAADLESMQTIDDLAKSAAETHAGADIVEVSGTFPHLLPDSFLDVTDLVEEIGGAGRIHQQQGEVEDQRGAAQHPQVATRRRGWATPVGDIHRGKADRPGYGEVIGAGRGMAA